MTYRATAYDTIACSGAMIDKIVVVIQSIGTNDDKEYCGIGLINGLSETSRVPSFLHPIWVEKQRNIFVDVRAFTSYDKFTDELRIKNPNEYRLFCTRGAINKIWIIDRPSYIRDLSPLPIATYTAWLSENIARRFTLDGDAQYKVAILSAIFYNSHFTDDKELSSHDKQHLASYLSRQLRFSGEDVFAALEEYSVIHSIDEFCEAVKNYTRAINLQQLNKGTLVGLISNTFYGVNASEMAAVAIEHPPTWMSVILDSIVNYNFYRKTIVGTIVNRKQFDESRSNYAKAIQTLISHYE